MQKKRIYKPKETVTGLEAQQAVLKNGWPYSGPVLFSPYSTTVLKKLVTVGINRDQALRGETGSDLMNLLLLSGILC